MVPENLVSFIEGGMSMAAAAARADGTPACVRAVGACVAADRSHVAVLVPAATSSAVLACVEENKRLALLVTNATTHRSIQFKGGVLNVRPATEAERARALNYRRAFAEHLALVGVSPRHTGRLTIDPCMAIEMTIDEIYRQTPGPDAGAKLERGL